MSIQASRACPYGLIDIPSKLLLCEASDAFFLENPLPLICKRVANYFQQEVKRCVHKSSEVRDKETFLGLLQSAVIQNDIHRVNVIIENVGSVNEKNSYGETPLYLAVEKKNLKVVEILLNAGANISIRNRFEVSPLDLAIFKANDQKGIFFLEELLRLGVNNFNEKNGFGDTSLIKAIVNNKIEAVRSLIEAGADVNLKDSLGLAPLHHACIKGDFETARFLIEANAHINAQDRRGFTPLHIACKNGDYNLAKFLIERGADVLLADRLGAIPLTFAFFSLDLETVKLLFWKMGFTYKQVATLLFLILYFKRL